MKVRNGFVSNSSSSSFIILLPENFSINTIDFQKILDSDPNDYYDTDLETVKSCANQLLEYGEFHCQDGYDEMYILSEAFKPYVIASIDTGPDDGQINCVDINKVKKIMNL